jgi:mannitol-specific phosphotransferase system IIBC component
MADHVADTTQAINPGRATIRTAIQTAIPAFLGLLWLVPLIIQEVVEGFGQHLPDGFRLWLGAAAVVITAAAATLTRIMAIPGVIEWTRAYLPWLAPDRK